MEKRKTINRQNITEHLIEYQLKMVGKTINEITTDEKWFTNNTISPEQYEEFKAYAIPLLKKVFKFNKAKAEQTFSWFDLSYGLRIKS
jgi:hypothetical protein